MKKKEAKILVKSPNPFFFAQFNASTSPEKLGFRTDLTKPTAPLLTYDKLVLFENFHQHQFFTKLQLALFEYSHVCLYLHFQKEFHRIN